VATISRLLKIIGLFCKRGLQKRRYSAKETYDFQERTNRSHPTVGCDSDIHVSSLAEATEEARLQRDELFLHRQQRRHVPSVL